MILTIEEIKRRLLPVMKQNNVARAVLFGSYSKGKATENSDVDLMVESHLHGLDFVGLIEDIRQSLLDKEVDVIDISQILPGSKISEEIERTGVSIYVCS